MTLKKASHCAYQTHYHIVFPVKYRKALLYPEVEKRLKTARELFKSFPWLKKELWGGEFWSDGYYAATVGEGGNWKVVENYVANQGKEPEKMKQLRLF